MLDRTIAPLSGVIDFPNLQEVERFNNSTTPLFALEAGQVEAVKLDITFESGLWHESKASLSWFAAKMLNKGTSKLSSHQIAEQIDALGAFMEINPAFDSVGISIYGLRNNFEQVINLVSTLLFEASFPADELELLKAKRIDELRLNNSKSEVLASKKIREAVFGTDYPYGRSLDEIDIMNISQDDVKQYYEKQLFNQAQIFVSGRVDGQLIDYIQEKLVFTHSESGIIKKKRPSSSNRSIVIEKEDAMQSSLRCAWDIPNMKDDDYLNYLIANIILGGYFGSRLMKNIREEKGYTYGINSYPVHLRNASFSVISSDVKVDNTKDTMREIEKEIKKLQSEGVDQEELDTVGQYLAGSFLSSISTPFQLMSKFQNVHSKGMNYEYYKRYFEKLQNLSSDDVNSAALKYFDWDKMYFSLVGKNI